MEFFQLSLVILAIFVVVVAVLGLVRLTGRRRPPSTDQEPPAGTATGEPTGTATAEPTADPLTPQRVEPAPEEDLPQLRRPDFERPEPSAGRLARLRSRLGRAHSAFGGGLLGLLSRDHLDEETWEEVEDVLLGADVGVGPAQELVERLRTRVKSDGTRTPDDVRTLLREELLTLVGTDVDRSLNTAQEGRPAVVLVVGVNGTGKTTTVGKLARVLVADGRTVLLGAADTFRAAAADQLQTWGERVGALTVRGPAGGDPASVAYDAVRQAVAGGYDVVLLDTAGRLQNKVGLMDELGKVKRVVEKQGPVDEVLLVLDATTGQNGLQQARVFGEVVDVTGIVLTKLDGTAKGGIVVAVQRELGVPVKLVGLGEGADDLAPFEPEAFVDALINP